MMQYLAYIHKDPGSDFGVSFPDFPGCISAGRTIEEAQRNAAKALKFHIQGMKQDGERIPKPSRLVRDPDFRKAVAVFLVDLPVEKAVRVNFTARESQLAQIDMNAKQAGLSRSAYMVQRSLEPHRK